jgi:hypothetical protein
MEAQAVARCQSEIGWQAYLHDGIVEPRCELHAHFHQIARAAAGNAVYPGAQLLRFVFTPFRFNLIGFE